MIPDIRKTKEVVEGDGVEVCDILLSLQQQEAAKLPDQATRKKKSRSRFLWSVELHNQFISAIFDIGLYYVNIDVIHQLMVRNSLENNRSPLSLEKTLSHLNVLREFHRGRSRTRSMVRLSSNRLDRCVDVESVVESHMEQMREFKSQRSERKQVFQPPQSEPLLLPPPPLYALDAHMGLASLPRLPPSFTRAMFADSLRGASRIQQLIPQKRSAEISYIPEGPWLMGQTPYLTSLDAFEYRIPSLKAWRDNDGNRVEYDFMDVFQMQHDTRVPI